MSDQERKPLSAGIQLDDAADVATIYGIKVSGELLRMFTTPTPPGTWFRIIKVEGDVCTIHERLDPGTNDYDLWTMVRVYHGWQSDKEMIDAIGYDLELHVAKMRLALAAIAPK